MSKKVLLVDDSVTVRQSVAYVMEQNNFVVTQGVYGVDGVSKAKSDKFDLIITDINMPNMNGIGLIKEVRNLPEYRFTPILVLTTESEASKVQEGKEAGATGWLVKPFNSEKLLATIAKVLR